MVTTFEADLASAKPRRSRDAPKSEARLRGAAGRLRSATTKAAIPEVSAAFNYIGFYNFLVLPKNVAVLGVLAS
jgi:hypothetical protein